MTSEDIEATFKSHVDAIDQHPNRVRYHIVAESTFERGARRVVKSARYDVEEQIIEMKRNFYLDGEVVGEGDWAHLGDIHEPGELTETRVPDEEFDEDHFVITHYSPEAGANTGATLGEAITAIAKREFFSTSVEGLGEIFDHVLECNK